jgi:hypothetical protein
MLFYLVKTIVVDNYEREDIPMMWGYGFGGGGLSLMLLGMAFWIALLVALVWALVRASGHSLFLHIKKKIVNVAY